MNFNYSEAEEYEADFAAIGEIEFDEIESADETFDLALLAAQVRAARNCGA